MSGWWEDYRCGCVSKVVKFKKDLVGYCARHGESRRNVWPAKTPDAARRPHE